MSQLNRVLLFGCVAVVSFDALASVLSLWLGFQYSNAFLGSLLIYAVAGYFAARARSVWYGVGVGAALGAADATLGWAASWALGPGRSPSGTITLAQWFVVAIVVIIVAALCAGVGGIIGNLVKRSKEVAA